MYVFVLLLRCPGVVVCVGGNFCYIWGELLLRLEGNCVINQKEVTLTSKPRDVVTTKYWSSLAFAQVALLDVSGNVVGETRSSFVKFLDKIDSLRLSDCALNHDGIEELARSCRSLETSVNFCWTTFVFEVGWQNVGNVTGCQNVAFIVYFTFILMCLYFYSGWPEKCTSSMRCNFRASVLFCHHSDLTAINA